MRHVLLIVNRADNDRLVRVAFEKIDYHFLADTGNEHRAPFIAGKACPDTDPRGRFLVVIV